MESKKSKIQELYENQKSRSFVNHLIQSYLPVYKVQKVWEFEDKKPNHKCSICGHKLIDLGTVMGRMHESREYASDFMDSLRKQINGEEIKREDHPMIKHITHGAIMAFSGEKTTTLLCQDCVKELLEFTTNGLMMGDKNISYQINKMKRSSLFDSFTSSSSIDEDERKKVKDIQKRVEKAPKHTATLGDLQVLQDLKKRMEEDEKSKH